VDGSDGDEFYQVLEAASLNPLWRTMAEMVPEAPAPAAAPVAWPYALLRPLLMRAGDLLTAEEAVRRVLQLQNPGLRDRLGVTETLYAGLQLVLPGEVAPAHRHTMNAIRFVMEGEGGFTTIDGEKVPMARGDFLVTPGWTFHDHAAEGDRPMIWLDGLDGPLVNLFGANFSELANASRQMAREGADGVDRFGHGLAPVDWEPAGVQGPARRYPYARARPALAALVAAGEVDPHHGAKMRYVDPATGGWPTPTIGAFLQALPAGFAGAPCRSTDGTVFVCVEGRGSSRIGGTTIEWSENDVFVVPPWAPVSHRAAAEAVLFSISDRPAQKALGLWREQRSA
jgi:gentisate 1,2-dioxygenase